MNYFDPNNLHKLGKLPDRYYYQLNGKTAQENYNAQRYNYTNRGELVEQTK